MSLSLREMNVSLRSEFAGDHLPLLRWLMFTGVTGFGFVLVWYYGLFHLMLSSDKTYISAIIVLLYAVISLHCLMRTVVVSRELDVAHRVSALVGKGLSGFKIVGDDVVAGDGTILPRGQITTHIRNLILKARLQGHHRLDQTLLLRGLADALRGPNQLGSFASDSLMKLGLLGTIIGFILMLAPIAGLDAADHASVKNSMGLMSDGMAVAMYTTLTGLIGSVLVQTQYYMLDEATQKLFAMATDLTEVFVVSTLEREHDG
jgi:MotA/TolQ/ExbB proton channel family